MKHYYKPLLITLAILMLGPLGSFAQTGWIWAKSAGSTGLDGTRDIYTDAAGNTYATGTFSGITATFGSITLTNADPNGFNRDIFVAKYDTDGNVLWAKSAGGTGNDAGNAIAVDGDGNVYITGEFKGTADFSGTSLSQTNANTEEIFVAKYNSSGTMQWAKRAGGVGRDWGYGIAVDQDGAVYVTGNFTNNVDFDGTPYSSISGNNADGYIAKFNTNGSLLWVEQIGGSNPGGQNSLQSSNAIAYNMENNTFSVLGWYYGKVTWGGLGGVVDSSSAYPNSGLYSGFVATYDSSGAIQWVSSIDEEQVNSSGHSEFNDIAIDGDDNIYIVGSVAGKLTYAPGQTIEMVHTNSWNFDVFTAKYNDSGVFQWVEKEGAEDTDVGNKIVVNNQNDILITGSYSTALTIGTYNLPLVTNGLLLVRYSSTGNVLWAFGEPGAYLSNPLGLGVDAQGHIYVGGEFLNNSTFGGINITAVGLNDSFLAKYGQATGLEEDKGYLPVKVYPNPSGSYFIAELPENSNKAEIELYDISGRTVLNKSYDKNEEISIENLDNGLYMLKLTLNDKTYLSELVVSK